MAYNYLELVNAVNRRLNEVELTSSNFSTAIGFYADAKEAVNSSIRHINQHEYEWPFNHNTQDDTLVAGTTRYAFQADCKIVDKDSFRIQRDDTIGNATQKIDVLDYDQYLMNAVDQEYNTSTGIRALPKMVFFANDNKYGLWPVPDAAYTLTYEYYSFPTDLSAFDDVPTIPERFKYVIVEGAMYYAYMFRSNIEAAKQAQNKFNDYLKDMRKLLINNNYTYLRSGMIVQNQGGQAYNSSKFFING